MDWLDRMNKSIEYIEANLDDDISYDEAARIACCSTYHYQRMFSYITDVPLSEYIRRRRLTLAAFDLQTSDKKVIDLALKYGYDSPEAFTRAFKKMHGVSPVSARDIGVTLKAYPKMTFSISIKGDNEMNYRIEEKEAFEVFGVCGTISREMNKSFEEVHDFCVKCDEDGSVDKINELLGRSNDTMLHAALYDYTENNFKYMICYNTPKNTIIPDEFTRLAVPKSTWAIFSAPNGDVPGVWKRVYSEWFPTSGYEEVEGASFEMYYGVASNNISEVWIQVRKKN